MKNFYPMLSNRKIEDLITVRASIVRKAILKNDMDLVKSYMPAFLFETCYNGHKASDEVLKTLTGG